MNDRGGEVEPDGLALCTREQAKRLVWFDHHRVVVQGKPCVMLTYHWMPLEEAEGPLWLQVVHRHAAAHPPVPPKIQGIVDQLRFHAFEFGR